MTGELSSRCGVDSRPMRSSQHQQLISSSKIDDIEVLETGGCGGGGNGSGGHGNRHDTKVSREKKKTASKKNVLAPTMDTVDVGASQMRAQLYRRRIVLNQSLDVVAAMSMSNSFIYSFTWFDRLGDDEDEFGKK